MLSLKNLEAFYASTGPERVGFIRSDGWIFELENVSATPLVSFDVAPADLISLDDSVIALWHTHPGGPSNLSAEDYMAFRNWPDLLHVIIGQDGIVVFEVTKAGKVVMRHGDADNLLSRPAEGEAVNTDQN